MNTFKLILSFLNLLDRAGKLSITHLAVYICLAKLILVPHATIAEVGALFISILGYSHKRKVTADSVKQDQDVQAKIDEALNATKSQLDEMQSKINGLVMRVK